MIKVEKIIIPSASLGKASPMPDIKNISYIHAGYEVTDRIEEDEKTYIGKGMISTMLPYTIQDRYDREKKNKAYSACVLENEYLRAVFIPELGGRLWSLYDKEKCCDLLYVNPVFQPANLGLRNAWFSGGVEFNVGIKGHSPLSCSPLWARIDKYEGGDILRLYEFERIRGVVYSINAYLPENSPVLYIKCIIENRERQEKSMYWWSNIAVPETKGTRIIVPTDTSFLCLYNYDHYVVDKASIPIHDGIDVTYPDNISASKDFFYKIPKDSHKWIASANKYGNGLLHCSTRELKGRKLFVWGQGQGGRHWNEWLSEENSSYIEIQAGLASTQLEHIPMKGQSTWEWTEAYTALSCNASDIHSDYEKAISTIENYMLDRVGDPDKLTIPDLNALISSEIVYRGSEWGALEEEIRGEKISRYFDFERTFASESSMWFDLAEKDIFPEPDITCEPESYVVGSFWAEKLEKLKEVNWYSLLHLGVVKYASGDLDGARRAFEGSLELKPSPWAYRNLSMLYRNEFSDCEKAREYILKAFGLKKDSPYLCKEVAMQLTEDGGDEIWLEIFESLPNELKSIGRLRLYKAIALINLGRYREATEIVNKDFIMSDIKEGELSISSLWFRLYRRIYAEENGVDFSESDHDLIRLADSKYPLPKSLDFRMHD
ncbi:MAG: DUF5107 domain-containing protein [Clostridia bacterium]|nr:DUF5107 domain-containing protein [Clostridia bacterium]